MILFCVSWPMYFFRFFSIQEVILGSTFALNFISWSKFSSLLFPQKARPLRERNWVFRSIVKKHLPIPGLFANYCFIKAFIDITNCFRKGKLIDLIFMTSYSLCILKFSVPWRQFPYPRVISALSLLWDIALSLFISADIHV